MKIPAMDEALQHRLALIADSFRRVTGQILVDDASPEGLWNAPRVIVAHGTEVDPVFFYGNLMALDVFEMDFATFTCLPSRYSAEPMNREDRAHLLERVSRDGFIDDYSGVRVSGRGQRFMIRKAVVWNLIDPAGRLHGQAATFDRWDRLPPSPASA